MAHSVYFFTDETGNQTGGKYFIVAGVALTADVRGTSSNLREIECIKDGIGLMDWHRTRRARTRCRYLCSALSLPSLVGRMFWVRFEGRRDYYRCTMEALQLAMRHYGGDNFCVIAHEG